jgi:anti-anti-sigma factor
VELSESQLSGIPLIEVGGEVDHLNCPLLMAAVERALEAGGNRIAFDLTNCPYMDSAGISVLLSLLRRLGPAGWAGVISTNPDLLRVFEIVGLTDSQSFRVFSERRGVTEAAAETPS